MMIKEAPKQLDQMLEAVNRKTNEIRLWQDAFGISVILNVMFAILLVAAIINGCSK